MASSPIRRSRGIAFVILGLAATAPLSAQAAGEPQVTPVSVQPQLRNAEQAGRVLEVVHPATLKAAGIEGTVILWLHVDAMGRVTETRLKESSGFVAYDDAAAEVARAMTFTPAQRDGAAVPAWINMNIRFPGDATAAPAAPAAAHPAPAAATAPRPASAPAPAPAPAPAASAPPATDAPVPMTVAPRLQNVAEVRAALVELYPRILRETGIGGIVQVRVFIDEGGVVREARVHETSGYDDMDDAALEVAKRMRFTPARNGDAAIPVWVAVPIEFAVAR